VECPREIIDTIGGWKRDGVGEAYGKGFSLDITNSWMMLI
jgi:hypothetical protein